MNIWQNSSNDKIPVWGTHPLRRDGEFRMNAIPVYFLEHSAITAKSLKLAAFYAPDETMAPRLHAGEPVLFDRARSARSGDDALICLKAESTSPNEEETYLFRRVDKRSDGMLYLSALDERTKPVQIPLDRVKDVQRVLTWSDLLG